ncbi:MAG TPA: transglycosylase family protein [Solirubrobacterales bacterium]|nr:transglycosylase family protein [Solirubrobacterales bacterium]
MLIKRSHIAYIALALLAFPAAALATGGSAGPAIGPAQPALAPLQRPAESFQRTIDAVQSQIRADHRAAVRRQAREEREAFESLPGGVSLETLASIAACESGGDPTVVSSDGSYRGKYQFDYGTWESVGGSGDPAAATELEQDYRAALLYSRAGSSPWPICG